MGVVENDIEVLLPYESSNLSSGGPVPRWVSYVFNDFNKIAKEHSLIKKCLKPFYFLSTRLCEHLYCLLFLIKVNRDKIILVENRVHYVQILRKLGSKHKIFLHLHNYLGERKSEYLSRLDQEIYGYVSPSLGLKNFLTDMVGVPDTKIKVSRNGVDISEFKPARNTDVKTTKMIYIGRLDPQKGVHLLMEAYELLPHLWDRLELNVVGGIAFGSKSDSPYLANLRDLSRSINKRGGKVKLMGPKNHKSEVPDLLREADIFVLPSISKEVLPTALIEAMACGLYPISTDNIGGEEVVGSFGTVVSADKESISKAIESFLQLNLVEWIETRDKMVSSTTELYNWEEIRKSFFQDLTVALEGPSLN